MGAKDSPLRKVSIFPRRDISHQIITQRISTVFIDEHEGINDVPLAFAHLRAAKVPPAVNQQLRHLLIGKTDRVQHDEPVDAVRGD